MIFFVLFAVFLALVSASPPMTGAPGGIVNAAHTINDCDYGTYEERTHAGSPWAADCMKLVDNIFGDGTWYFGDNGEFRQLAQYQSCAFSARDEECGENPAFAGVSVRPPFLPVVQSSSWLTVRDLCLMFSASSSSRSSTLETKTSEASFTTQSTIPRSCRIPMPRAGWAVRASSTARRT